MKRIEADTITRLLKGMMASMEHPPLHNHGVPMQSSFQIDSFKTMLERVYQNASIVQDEICNQFHCDGTHFWVWLFMGTMILLSVIGVLAPSILVFYFPSSNFLNSTLFKFLQGLAAGFIVCVALVHC